MTDDEAIERIKARLQSIKAQTTADDEDCEILAQAAWLEIKAIAREDCTEGIRLPGMLARTSEA